MSYVDKHPTSGFWCKKINGNSIQEGSKVVIFHFIFFSFNYEGTEEMEDLKSAPDDQISNNFVVSAYN